jgi:hypothetical protein
MASKQTEYYEHQGDRWEVNYVEYESTAHYAEPGDRDEVIQIKKNDTQVGKITWHLDKHGNRKTKIHEEGIQRVPSGAKRV